MCVGNACASVAKLQCCARLKSIQAPHIRAAVDVKREELTKHGFHGHPSYGSWAAMMTRCYNRDDSNYLTYGAKGIVVCERWKSVENFIADMGSKAKGMSIDRWPNGQGNYEPGNCRWATAEQQANNICTNVRILHNGREQTASEWGRELGISPKVITKRIRNGKDAGQALKKTK